VIDQCEAFQDVECLFADLYHTLLRRDKEFKLAKVRMRIVTYNRFLITCSRVVLFTKVKSRNILDVIPDG
jgi:hypothetical protein